VPVPVPVPVPSPARAIAAAQPSLAVAPVPDSPALTTTLVPMMDVRPIVAADTPALGHGTPRGGVRRADSTARIPVQARRAPRAHTAGAEAAAPIPVPRKRLRTRVVKAALAVAALLAAFALWRASTSGSSASAEPMNVAAHAAPSSLAASASPTLMSVGFVTTEPPSVPPETAQTGGEANDGTPLPAKPRPTRIAPKLRVSGPAWD